MNYKLISIILFNFISSNIFSQNCIETKLEIVEYINDTKENISKHFIEEDKIQLIRFFENKNFCKYLEDTIYIYTSRFFMSGYSSETSSISHSIYLFTENFELICWYAGNTKFVSKKLEIPLLIQRNEAIKDSDMNYIKTILKQIAKNDTSNIEKEQNVIKSQCDCINYESVYQFTPDKTKVYFLDLYYKKLFNGDFMSEEEKQIFDEQFNL